MKQLFKRTYGGARGATPTGRLASPESPPLPVDSPAEDGQTIDILEHQPGRLPVVARRGDDGPVNVHLDLGTFAGPLKDGLADEEIARGYIVAGLPDPHASAHALRNAFAESVWPSGSAP